MNDGDIEHMRHCLELASKGLGDVSPNPLVGSVIVHEGKVIGSGYHEKFGNAHAEVNAIASVKDRSLLRESTLYVNLEPCSHTGKTPPCSNAIVEAKIPRVVFGMVDPNPKVSGSGKKILEEAGIEVLSGVLESECKELNKRFIVNQTEKRPFVVLKWAETSDGFIARADKSSKWISSEESRKLVHKWRSEEDSVLVGTSTAIIDNPKLNVRDVSGRDPVRVFIDKELKVPRSHNLFSSELKTFCLTEKAPEQEAEIEFLEVPFDQSFWTRALSELYARDIGSILIEGGTFTLESLIKQDLWDEARVFKSPQNFREGVSAPSFSLTNGEETSVNQDRLFFVRNDRS